MKKILKFLAGLACLLFVFCAFPAQTGICILAAAILVYNGYRVDRQGVRLAYYAGAAAVLSFANSYLDFFVKALAVGFVLYSANRKTLKMKADR